MSSPTRWIHEQVSLYGGRRNAVRVHAARIVTRMGAHRGYQQVDWPRVRRLVFVCKGNICRSPYAEFQAHSRGLSAVSAGVAATTGLPVHPDALREAQRRGIDLAPARTKPLGAVQLRQGDLVLFLEPGHALAVRDAVSATDGIQQSLLGLWSTPVTPLIPDPYGRDQRQFAVCFDLIDAAIAAVTQRLDRGAARDFGSASD